MTIANVGQVLTFVTNVTQSVNQEELLKDLELVNALIERTEDQTGLTNYPSLRERIELGPITGAEFLDYRTTFSITDEQFDYYIISQPEYIINTLENFYFKDRLTTGGMSYCSLVASNLFKVIRSILNGTAMERIQSLASGAWFKELVDQATNAIKNMFENLKKKFEGVLMRIGNLQNTVKTRIDSFMKKIDREVTRINMMLAPENMEKMIKRVQDQISSFIDKIKELNDETIQYLAYMICKSTGPIEQQMRSPIDALSSRIGDIEGSYGRLDSISKATTHAAVMNGAYRIDGNVRNEAVANQQGSGGGGTAKDPGVVQPGAQARLVNPVTSDEVANVTKWTPPGVGDSRIRFGPGLSEGRMGREGWEVVDIRLRVVAMRLQKRMGQQLQINSGYRSPEYNARTPGAAKRSLHMSGLALDITWDGFGRDSGERFITYALEEGIGGIGRYYTARNMFIHIDLGARRSWNG